MVIDSLNLKLRQIVRFSSNVILDKMSSAFRIFFFFFFDWFRRFIISTPSLLFNTKKNHFTMFIWQLLVNSLLSEMPSYKSFLCRDMLSYSTDGVLLLNKINRYHISFNYSPLSFFDLRMFPWKIQDEWLRFDYDSRGFNSDGWLPCWQLCPTAFLFNYGTPSTHCTECHN